MTTELTTEKGERLQIIYHGRRNGDSGPDFRDAVITTKEGKVLRGDIELHVKSSHWYSHGHQDNTAYSAVQNVIVKLINQRKTCGS